MPANLAITGKSKKEMNANTLKGYLALCGLQVAYLSGGRLGQGCSQEAFGFLANAWKQTEFKPQISTPTRVEEMTLIRKSLSLEVLNGHLLP